MLEPLCKLLVSPAGEPTFGAEARGVVGIVALEVEAFDLDDDRLEPPAERRVCGEIGEALGEAIFDGAM